MRLADGWHPDQYALLDTSGGEKLECFGGYLLVRPDPQIIWDTNKAHPDWRRPHAHYHRSSRGGGSWEMLRPLPESWTISYRDLQFVLRPTGFKHTGIFPEQAVNWDLFASMLKQHKPSSRRLRVLNLFAYTGAATMACAKAGAEVSHVDASKGMVAWAKQNALACGLSDHPIRYLVDDCEKFLAREIRRGNRYDAVILDPPSYGRGPAGEVWQLEQKIYPLLLLCRQVLVDRPLFFALNSYTTGLSPAVMSYLLSVTIGQTHHGHISADEIALPVSGQGRLALPCGSTALWLASDSSES